MAEPLIPRTFYVSLAADLLGVYIEYQATSRLALNQYLEREYLRSGIWKLPWCAIYDTVPGCPHPPGHPTIVKAICGTIEEEYNENA